MQEFLLKQYLIQVIVVLNLLHLRDVRVLGVPELSAGPGGGMVWKGSDCDFMSQGKLEEGRKVWTGGGQCPRGTQTSRKQGKLPFFVFWVFGVFL